MASIRKRGNTWQAIIARGGVRKSATWDTKAQAVAWAAHEESRILAARHGEIPPGITFGQLLERYRDEVVVNKRGEKWETTRINMILRDDPIANILLTNFAEPNVAAWRDRRLKSVSGSSVLREWTILSHACTIATKEWRWLKHNPFKEVSRPEGNPSRSRRPTPVEVECLLRTLVCDPQVTPVTKTARVGFAFLFALETAMRAGEIVGLKWADITGHTAVLRMTKNGHGRVVPLSREALRLISLLPHTGPDGSVFQIESQQLDFMFRRATAKALIEDLHFHDSRREALTRLAKKLSPMELAKVSGHRDLRILLNVYYAPDVADMASRIG
jgi:integrase